MVVYRKWYVLGLMLNVSVQTLDRIRAQFSDSQDQLLEMLKTWLKTAINPSWKTLAYALRSPGVEEMRLSEFLQKKYFLIKETEVYESKR